MSQAPQTEKTPPLQRQMGEEASRNQPSSGEKTALSLHPSTDRTLRRRERRFRKRGFSESTKAFQVYTSQDWDSLRAQFFDSRTDGGECTYKSLRAFVNAKFLDSYSRRVAYCAVGSKPTGMVPWRGDWAAERRFEQTRGHARLQVLAERLGREVETTATAGPLSEPFVDMFGRAINWLDQLHDATSNMLVLEDQPLAAQAARLKLFLEAHERVMTLMERAANCVLNLRGGKELLVYQMVARFQRSGQEPSSDETRLHEIMAKVAHIAIERCRAYNLPLPEPLKEALTEDERKELGFGPDGRPNETDGAK